MYKERLKAKLFGHTEISVDIEVGINVDTEVEVQLQYTVYSNLESYCH